MSYLFTKKSYLILFFCAPLIAEFYDKPELIGLSRIVAFHLNDSKKALGSRVDRHENLGKGLLGEALFRRLVQDARFAEIPAVLETAPAEGKFPYKDEVALLKSFRVA